MNFKGSPKYRHIVETSPTGHKAFSQRTCAGPLTSDRIGREYVVCPKPASGRVAEWQGAQEKERRIMVSRAGGRGCRGR